MTLLPNFVYCAWRKYPQYVSAGVVTPARYLLFVAPGFVLSSFSKLVKYFEYKIQELKKKCIEEEAKAAKAGTYAEVSVRLASFPPIPSEEKQDSDAKKQDQEDAEKSKKRRHSDMQYSAAAAEVSAATPVAPSSLDSPAPAAKKYRLSMYGYDAKASESVPYSPSSSLILASSTLNPNTYLFLQTVLSKETLEKIATNYYLLKEQSRIEKELRECKPAADALHCADLVFQICNHEKRFYFSFAELIYLLRDRNKHERMTQADIIGQVNTLLKKCPQWCEALAFDNEDTNPKGDRMLHVASIDEAKRRKVVFKIDANTKNYNIVRKELYVAYDKKVAYVQELLAHLDNAATVGRKK